MTLLEFLGLRKKKKDKKLKIKFGIKKMVI
jgi:hypothetical protein